MHPVIEVGGARVFLGDCREVLRGLPDNSVDSVVTDPPYELGFMGKKWDSSGIAYDVNLWMDCLRVLKPGGHILAFGGSRTWHRLAVAIEDAGFEIRDNIAWIYGSGFPKSLDVSKAIDKRAGAEREVVGKDIAGNGLGLLDRNSTIGGEFDLTVAATNEAKQWQGWGTALKPAFEPVVVGRKPLVGTVAENVLAWGVGGLNIDGSRIAGDVPSVPQPKTGGGIFSGKGGRNGELSSAPQGRWPANVILDEVTAGLLDEQSGNVKGQVGMTKTKGGHRFIEGDTETVQKFDYSKTDSGGASRFFYVAKACKRDRNEGLEEGNGHPTVKPTQLMRYLIKLVTPPGGTVLDPFTGSGSTGKAALLDGFGFLGAELTEEYLPIIEGRLRWANEQEGETDERLF